MIRLLLQFWVFRVLLVAVLLLGFVIGMIEYLVFVVAGVR